VTRRTAVLLVTLALGLSACSAITGRPFVEWSDDKAITARVKARLTAVKLNNLSRVNVDTYESVVYLSGIVDSAEIKARTEAAATAVQGVRQVVSNLVAREAARDRDGITPSALPAAAMARPVPAPLVGVVRLEGSRAYDQAGRHVATVYTVSTDLAHAGAERFRASRPVDHVTVHAMPGDSSVPTAHYLLVLWHVPELTPAR
jgi:hypothetical protein